VRKESAWWKRIIDVQAPYRWNLCRLNPGFTLDIGCGLGRNLINLSGNGVGIDHNPHSVEIASSRGLRVFTPESFEDSSFNKHAHFDSILLSHVVEHNVGRGSRKAIGHIHSSVETTRAGHFHHSSRVWVSVRSDTHPVRGLYRAQTNRPPIRSSGGKRILVPVSAFIRAVLQIQRIHQCQQKD